jgi:hypothetical protein
MRYHGPGNAAFRDWRARARLHERCTDGPAQMGGSSPCSSRRAESRRRDGPRRSRCTCSLRSSSAVQPATTNSRIPRTRGRRSSCRAAHATCVPISERCKLTRSGTTTRVGPGPLSRPPVPCARAYFNAEVARKSRATSSTDRAPLSTSAFIRRIFFSSIVPARRSRRARRAGRRASADERTKSIAS